MRLERPLSIDSSAGEPRVPRRIHLMTLLIVLLAVTGFAVAQSDYGMNWQRSALLIGQVLLAGAAAVYFRRIARDWPEPPAITPILVGLALVSYLREPITRWIWETGRPFEMVAMHSLRDLILGLGAASCWGRFQKLTVLMSLFLMIFSAAIARDRVVAVICGLYAIVCLATLVAAYWETLLPRMLKADDTHQTRRWLVLGLGIAVLLVAVRSEAGKPVVRVLRGFMPSSGGDGDAAPHARDGVGDGDALVAGMDDIRTFGPIEDAPFISDHKPSLYDVFDDRYEEPVKVTKQDRAIALPAEMAAKIQERHLQDNQTVSREFSVLRQPKKSKTQRKSDAVRTNALMYVSGRTPLHLRMELYDLFDGIEWHPEATPEVDQLPPLRIETIEGRPWLLHEMGPRNFDVLAERETHALKIIQFDSPRIPSPLYTSGVHIDRVDTVAMYSRSKFGMIALNRKELPEMVPIHLCSATLDRRRVSREFTMLSGGMQTHHHVPAIEGMGRIRDLAKQWTQGVPRGMEQVEAIARRLREGFVLDDTARPESGCPSPVAHFLFISQRGPDYLFASSAALMLRSLGYSTRIVTGFYADPRQYDRKSGHTPVTREDAHTWVECSLGAHYWATVEATPGYEVLGPPPGLVEQVMAWLQRGALLIWDHRLPSGIVLCGLLVIYALRRSLLDIARTVWWRWRVEIDPRQRVLSTLRLLQNRLAGCGLIRPHSMTFTSWLEITPLRGTPVGDELRAIARIAEWARYGGDHPVDVIQGLHAACRMAEASSRRSMIRKQGSHAGQAPSHSLPVSPFLKVLS